MLILSCATVVVLIGIGSIFSIAHLLYWSKGVHQSIEESYIDYQTRLMQSKIQRDLDRPWTYWGYCGLFVQGCAVLLLIIQTPLSIFPWLLLLGTTLCLPLTFFWRVRMFV